MSDLFLGQHSLVAWVELGLLVAVAEAFLLVAAVHDAGMH